MAWCDVVCCSRSVQSHRSSICHSGPLELVKLTKSDTEVENEVAAENLTAVSSAVREVMSSDGRDPRHWRPLHARGRGKDVRR